MGDGTPAVGGQPRPIIEPQRASPPPAATLDLPAAVPAPPPALLPGERRAPASNDPVPSELAPASLAPGNLVVDTNITLAPERADAARGLLTGLLDETRTLAGQGVEVDPGSAATGAKARTKRELGVRELAAIVNDVPADRVTDAQVAALRTRNAQLTGDRVPAGTVVDLGATPRGLDLAQRHLRLTREILAGQSTGDVREQLAAVESRLTQVTRARQQLGLARSIAAADETLARLPADRRISATYMAYERVRRELEQSQRAGTLSPDDATSLRTALADTEVRALARGMGDVADDFIKAARDRDERASSFTAARNPVGQAMLVRQNGEWRKDAQPETVRHIEVARDAAVRRLRESRTDANASAIDAQVARLHDDARNATARVHLAAGDPLAAERIYLPSELTRDGSVTQPNRDVNIGADGATQGFVDVLTQGTTRIGQLDDTRRDALVARIRTLPPEQRRQALDGLLQLADVYAAEDDRNRLSTTRQLLLASSEQLGEPALGMRVGFVEARYQTRIRNFDGARGALEDVLRRAGSLDGETGAALRREAVAGLVAVNRTQAAAGTDEEARDSGASALRSLRVRMQADGSPLTRDQQARLSLLEAQTFLERHDPERAMATLSSLDAYKDLPWAAATVEAFRRDHSEAGVTAALKVGLRYANSAGTGVMLGWTVGGGVIGAGVGMAVGGPPLAGAGFLLGSALGSVGSAGYTVARNWDRVTAAFDTGLTSLSARDATVDAAFVGLNIAGAVPPIAGTARAITMLRGPALMEQVVARVGPNASSELVRATTRELVAAELATVAGRLATPITLGGVPIIAGQLGSEYARIESMPPGPDREEARRQFRAALTEGGLVAAATLGTAMTISRLAAAANRRWQIPAPTVPETVVLPRATVVAGSDDLRVVGIDELQRRALPFTDIGAIPGMPGGVEPGNATHYLRTADIRAGELPYASEMRAPSTARPLPDVLETAPRAPIGNIYATVMASDEHSGGGSLVRLAALADGRPVVVKSYAPGAPGEPAELLPRLILREARSLQLQDELGIGPRYHGIVREGGRWGVAMDIVPGDSVGMPVTATTFRDAEAIIERLRTNGYQELSDFQVYRTDRGRLLTIDGSGFVDDRGVIPQGSPNGVDGSYTKFRFPLFRQAPPDVGFAYLEQLRLTNREAFIGLLETIDSHRSSAAPWAVSMRESYGAYVDAQLRSR